jgi:hypothetical protein
VTTGEALVALDAQPPQGEGMASGDVVSTAARLQAAEGTSAAVARHSNRHEAVRQQLRLSDMGAGLDVAMEGQGGLQLRAPLGLASGAE